MISEFCEVCGVIDDHYDEYLSMDHKDTPKHMYNRILREYCQQKKRLSGNRDGVVISGWAVTSSNNTDQNTATSTRKIIISVKPNEDVRFKFKIANDLNNDDMLIIGVQLGHPQPQFKMNHHKYIFGEDPHLLKKKSSLIDKVWVDFKGDIGQYEMPIIFTFVKIMENKEGNNTQEKGNDNKSNTKTIIIIREMVVRVQENPIDYVKIKTPYKQKDFGYGNLVRSTTKNPNSQLFKIPKPLKTIFAVGLNEAALEKLHIDNKNDLKIILNETRVILETGVSVKNNYILFFRHLLWWEEVIARINVRKYNMSAVPLEIGPSGFALEVPGLSEKRPSLLKGDRVYLWPVDVKEGDNVVFESVIKDVQDDKVILGEFDERFSNYVSETALFNVTFLLSREPMQRMHEAVSNIFTSNQLCRVFPEPMRQKVHVKKIKKFYNEIISDNEEQRSAVEHIASGSSGRSPYIVFGPPGTGKTMTIVEAIIQIVVMNPRNRVMVCTHSNMAADHIALVLLQYNAKLNISNFLFRANSRTREWSTMPKGLAIVSNGTNYDNFYPVSNHQLASNRIVVTTLIHAAKFGSTKSQIKYKLRMSHLFIDEAAQATEAAVLIPVTTLLAPSGQLVLAGDPKQLGPVCMSKSAAKWGLGNSLLQRLMETYPNLYNRPKYITTLVRNFRSDPDILKIPNSVYYEDKLVACAKPDPLSRISILNQPGGDRAIVFHAVNSMEQRMGKTPSFYNERELDMIKKYILSLIKVHGVRPEDIGVIAPYIRQIYKVKTWLANQEIVGLEVGTVESFQGKEKRVILVTTVRANCRLLDYDAKYDLGFLVDDKRFNVALTRAKAKIVIIGNTACLCRDKKWRMYMNMCQEYHSYLGRAYQQLDRTSAVLQEIAKTKFDKCRISEVLKIK